jgi:hypothetical protein
MAVLVHPLVQEVTRESAVNQNLEVLPGLSQSILRGSIGWLKLRMDLMVHAGH